MEHVQWVTKNSVVYKRDGQRSRATHCCGRLH
jgi:hypothetical protein